MATIPTRREQVAPSGQAAFDPFPGRERRAAAQEALQRTQANIQFARAGLQGLQLGAQVGAQAAEAIGRIRASQFAQKLRKFQEGLDKEFAENNIWAQDDAAVQYEAFFNDFFDENAQGLVFGKGEAKLTWETALAKGRGRGLTRQNAIRQSEGRAAVNDDIRLLQSQGQSLDPLEHELSLMQMDVRIDAAVEDGFLDAEAAGKLKQDEQLRMQRGRARQFPAETAIQGIEDGKLYTLATPDEKRQLIEQLEAKFYRDAARASTAEGAADKASTDASEKQQDAIMNEVASRELDGSLTTGFVQSVIPVLSPADARIAVSTVQQVDAQTDDPYWMQQIDDAIDTGNTDAAKHAITAATRAGMLTGSTAKSYRQQIRQRAENLTPAQKRGLSLIRENLAPPPGSRFEAPIYQEARKNAGTEYLNRVLANPTMSPEDVNALTDEMLQRYSVFVTDGIVEAFGIPAEVFEVNPDVNQDTISSEDISNAGFAVQRKLDEGLIERDEFGKKMEQLDLWRLETERRNKAQKGKPSGR